MKPLSLWTAFVLTFAACATSYQKTGLTGGFGDTQLAPDLFRVTFKGNGYTFPDRAQDFALLRAADLTIGKGFSCFAVVDEKNTTRVQTFESQGHAETTGSAFLYGNSASYSEHTTYTPGHTSILFKPTTGLLVKCFMTKPENMFTFDAAFLRKSIREKYEIK
jgi:hypothetical protein